MAAGLKFVFCCVTVLFTVAAAALTIGSILYSIKLKEYTDLRNGVTYQFDDSMTWPQITPHIFATVGCIALLVSLCGVCGAFGNNRSLLKTHSIFLFLTIALLIAAAAITATKTMSENSAFINKTVLEVFTESKQMEYVKVEYGKLEQFLHCCGVIDHQDYLHDSHFRREIPDTCCETGDTYCKKDLEYKRNLKRGCLEVALKYSNRFFTYGTIACGVTAFFGIFNVVVNIVLTMSLGRQRNSKHTHNNLDDKHTEKKLMLSN